MVVERMNVHHQESVLAQGPSEGRPEEGEPPLHPQPLHFDSNEKAAWLPS